MLRLCTLSRAFTPFAVLLLAITATACGGDDVDAESDPEGALRDAIQALGEWDGVGLTLSLQADETAREAMREEMSDDAIDRVLGGSLGLLATNDGDTTAMALDVTIDGSEVAAVQFHDESDIYLRVDFEAIAELVDDPDLEAELSTMLAEAEQFGLGDAADGLQQGGWVHVTGLEQMMNMVGGMDGATPPDEADEEESERLVEEVSAHTLAFVDGDVSVAHIGSEDAGERLRATTDGASLRTYLTDLTSIFAGSDLVGGLDQGMVEEDFSDIPSDEQVSLDVWVDGGEVSQIALDIASYADDLEGELLFVVAMEEYTGGIDAPTDVTTVDLFQIVGQFMGGLGGGFGDDSLDDDGTDDDGLDDDGSDDDAGLSEEELDILLQDLIAEGECINQEDLDFLESFLGPEGADAIRSLVDQGVVEYC